MVDLADFVDKGVASVSCVGCLRTGSFNDGQYSLLCTSKCNMCSVKHWTLERNYHHFDVST